jgi:hypothetical protein
MMNFSSKIARALIFESNFESKINWATSITYACRQHIDETKAINLEGKVES